MEKQRIRWMGKWDSQLTPKLFQYRCQLWYLRIDIGKTLAFKYSGTSVLILTHYG